MIYFTKPKYIIEKEKYADHLTTIIFCEGRTAYSEISVEYFKY